MICKACGTQCRGPYCSHCGAPLENDAPKTPAAKPQDEHAVPAPLVAEPATAAPQAQNKGKAHRAGRPCVRVKLRQVFFPSLAFFLPLVYLFVDAFVVYSSALQASAEGGTVLRLLVTHLLDASFAANPVSDVIAATLGGDAPALTLLSVKGILTAPTAHPALVAPAVILLLSAVASALCGAAVLFTAGKILSRRPVAHLVIGVGFFASVAPLPGDLAFRLYHVANGGMAAADAAIDGVGFSVEVMLLCALSLAAMLPAVRAIRRAAGGEGVLVFPLYSLICRGPLVTRLLGGLFALAAIVLPLVCTLIEGPFGGKLFELFLNGLKQSPHNALLMTKAFFAGDFLAAVSAMLSLLALPTVLLMLLAVLPALFSLLRLLLIRPIKVALIKRRQGSLLRMGKRLRRITLTVPVLYTLFGIAAFLVLLLGAHAHVSLANVGETLTVMYLLIAFARSAVALTTTGVLLCACSLVLSNIAGSVARAFVAFSLEKHSKR